MSDLSHTALKVLDAFENASDGEYVEGVWVVNERNMLAAALRAAVDQVMPEEPLYGGDQRWMFERDARQEARKKLFVIADELEGVKYGTYRCNLKEK